MSASHSAVPLGFVGSVQGGHIPDLSLSVASRSFRVNPVSGLWHQVGDDPLQSQHSDAEVDDALRALDRIKAKQTEFHNAMEAVLRDEDDVKSRCHTLEILVRELQAARDELYHKSQENEFTIKALKW